MSSVYSSFRIYTTSHPQRRASFTIFVTQSNVYKIFVRFNMFDISSLDGDVLVMRLS